MDLKETLPTGPIWPQPHCSSQCGLPHAFLQECLQRFGDSLQEMVNYHTVSPMGHVGSLLPSDSTPCLLKVLPRPEQS